MTAPMIPDKVAVIGSGEIGSGWAALCAAAGWPVAVFDTNAVAVERAFETVPRRSRALIALDRAPEGVVERGLKELHHGLEMDRTSCSRFLANQFRVLLTLAAYILFQELRRRAAKTICADAQVTTLRERLIKLAVWV